MSDVSVASPAAGGASAPAHEVPVSVDTVNLPNAVGPQAPEHPTDKTSGRREAIQKAFERAQNPKAKESQPARKPAPKAAEAKVGHNQPPEKTEDFDLRKRPKGEVSQDSAPPRERGDHGHFAPRSGAQNAQQSTAQINAINARPGAYPKNQQGQVVNYHPNYSRLHPQAPYREPPNRFAVHAKHDWQHAPESVRGEVDRMYNEFHKAYKYFKADHDEMNTLRPFQKLAKACGTTMVKALSSYVSLEDKIRKNPLAGIDTVVTNLGLKTAEGQPISFRDICYYVATMTPEQYSQIQHHNAQIASNTQIAQARNEIAQLKQAWANSQAQQAFHYTRAGVDNYASTHPRLDELGDLIEQEIKHGYDLDTAYRRANLLRPPTHAAQTRNPSAQTRPATDRSISGSPGSSNGSRPAGKPSASPRDAVRNAISRMQGRA